MDEDFKSEPHTEIRKPVNRESYFRKRLIKNREPESQSNYQKKLWTPTTGDIVYLPYMGSAMEFRIVCIKDDLYRMFDAEFGDVDVTCKRNEFFQTEKEAEDQLLTPDEAPCNHWFDGETQRCVRCGAHDE